MILLKYKNVLCFLFQNLCFYNYGLQHATCDARKRTAVPCFAAPRIRCERGFTVRQPKVGRVMSGVSVHEWCSFSDLWRAARPYWIHESPRSIRTSL